MPDAKTKRKTATFAASPAGRAVAVVHDEETTVVSVLLPDTAEGTRRNRLEVELRISDHGIDVVVPRARTAGTRVGEACPAFMEHRNGHFAVHLYDETREEPAFTLEHPVRRTPRGGRA